MKKCEVLDLGGLCVELTQEEAEVFAMVNGGKANALADKLLVREGGELYLIDKKDWKPSAKTGIWNFVMIVGVVLCIIIGLVLCITKNGTYAGCAGCSLLIFAGLMKGDWSKYE